MRPPFHLLLHRMQPVDQPPPRCPFHFCACAIAASSREVMLLGVLAHCAVGGQMTTTARGDSPGGRPVVWFQLLVVILRRARKAPAAVSRPPRTVKMTTPTSTSMRVMPASERRPRIKRIGEGPSEVHRMVLARHLLGAGR